MADEIKAELGVQAELIPSGGGIFDVKANGKLIFSKHEVGRFPEDDEVLGKLEAMKRPK
ncbi:Rdx family protein [Phycisphaerae bacterium RAS1]|nr:Rdx family protein [Phycisphaerae bacterium RAS1]